MSIQSKHLYSKMKTMGIRNNNSHGRKTFMEDESKISHARETSVEDEGKTSHARETSVEDEIKISHARETSVEDESKISHAKETSVEDESKNLCNNRESMEIGIEIKKCTCIETDDLLILARLPYTNQELIALLYGGYRRNEVIFALRNPEKYLVTIKNLFDCASTIFDTLKSYALLHSIDVSNIKDTEVKCLDEMNEYVFHFFSCEGINIINNCYLYVKNVKNIRILNPDLEIRYSLALLSKMRQDILVTITRFEEYLMRFPSPKLRNIHIEQYFINTDYE